MLLIGIALAYFTSISENSIVYFGGIGFIFLLYPIVAVTSMRSLWPLAFVVLLFSAFENDWIRKYDDTTKYSIVFYMVTAIVGSFVAGGLKFKKIIELEIMTLKSKELRVKLSRGVEERKKLLRVLSHDLSNALFLIQNSLKSVKRELNLEEDDFDSKVAIALRRIEKAAYYQQEVIEHVRTNEALKDGKITVKHEAVSFRRVLERAELLFKDHLIDKGLQIEVEEEGSHLSFLADEVTFSNHVFNNLISNAIKFSFPDDVIIVRCYSSEEQWIIIEVEDNGMGMDEGALNHLFDSDKRTSRLGTLGEEGTGFGMPLMKTYVELFNGEIEVKSKTAEDEPINHGTKFSIKLKQCGARPGLNKEVLVL